MRTARLLLLAGLLCGCATAQTAATRELVERDLPGVWISGDSRMEITCEGTFYYDEPQSPNALLISRRESGGHVARLNEDSFIVGTAISLSPARYPVEAWPSSQGDSTVMTVEGMTWKRETVFSCSNAQ